jgi:hypothetical protein
MKDYTIAEWIDFSRGVTDENEAVRMRAHLTECAECRKVLEFCRKLAQTCGALAASAVPASSERLAMAILPRPAAPIPRRRFRIPLELVFDSFAAPVPAGLRSSWELGFQALYQGGDYSLDFRVEPGPPQGRATVIGQVLNRKTPGADMGGCGIYLKAGKAVIAQTLSNRFGEFQMEYGERKGLRLNVELADGHELEAPLRRLVSAEENQK